jgi:TP901 family phage tail tape measure protein
MAVILSVVGKYDGKDLERAQKQLATMQKETETFGNKMSALGGKMQSVGKSLASAGKSMTVGLTLPIVGIGVAATKMAMDFDTSLTKMVSLVGLTRDEVDGMRGDIITLASQYGKSGKEAADALFFITSAGLRGSDAMDTLEASLKGAAVGLGDVQTIADLATSAMNAYGPSSLSASNATDILANAVREGKLESSELAGAMGQVLPIASAMGVGFDEVGAAMAAMSRTGTGASQASTQLRSILTSLLKPTTKAEKAMAGMGLSSEGLRKQIREEGLLSVLQTLSKEFDGNDAAAAAVFGNVRALSGVMDLMGENADTTAKIFGNLTESTGILDEAMGAAAETTGFKLQQAFATLKNSLIEFGDIIAPFVQKFAARLSEIGTAFQNLSPQMKNFIVTGLAIAAAIGPLLLIAGKLIGAVGGLLKVFAGITIVGSLLAIKIIAVVAVLAAIGFAFKWAYDNSEPLRNAVDNLVTTFKNVFNIVKNSVLGAFSSMSGEVGKANTIFTTIGNYIKAFFTGYVIYLTTIIKVLGGVFQVAMKVFEIGFTILKMGASIIRGVLLAAFDILMNKLGPISKAFSAVANGVKSAFGAIAGFIRSAFSNVGKIVETFINFAITAVNVLIRAFNFLSNFLPGVSKATEIAEFRFAEMSGAADQAASSANNLANQVGGYAGQVMRGNQAVDAAFNTNTKAAKSFDDVAFAAGGAGSATEKAGGAAKKAGEKAKEAADKFRTNFTAVNEHLTGIVDDIKKKMADMATSVSSSLMRGFNLGDAAEEFGEDGARVGGTFMEKLQAQADKVTNFSAKIKELMELGLNMNSPLMQAVIAEGAGTGTAIAQSLIDAGAEGINQATGILQAAQGAADEIGTLAATNFYQAGLDSAQQTLQAFVDRFGVNGKARNRLMGLMDNLANAMKRETTITVTTINRVVSQKIDGARALGGPVHAGKAYLVGERGPEIMVMGSGQSGQVIPNSDLSMTGAGGGGRAGGAGSVINLTVNAGMGTQGAEVGRQIVDALKAYERRNGSVYVSA